jgi:hypothetical protein
MRRTPWIALALAVLPHLAKAYELDDGRLHLGVAAQAAYGRTDSNSFAPGAKEGGSKEGNYTNTVLALSISGDLSDRLRVSARFDIEPGETAEVDWAFAEWKASDALRIRAGMVKHAFGSYGEIKEEGTLRPMYYLATSVYGPGNISGEGLTGLALSGFARYGRWALGYDLYAGSLRFEVSPQLLRISDPALDPGERVSLVTRDLVGARLNVESPVGLAFRLSGYTGTEERFADLGRDIRHHTGLASLQYLGEALTFNAEAARMVEESSTETNAAYVELAWKFWFGLQLAARVEGSETRLTDTQTPGVAPPGTQSSNLHHREAAMGVNYWFSPDFVLRAEYHLVRGTRFAWAPFPEGGEGAGPPDPIPEPYDTTTMFLVGVQFAL